MVVYVPRAVFVELPIFYRDEAVVVSDTKLHGENTFGWKKCIKIYIWLAMV